MCSSSPKACFSSSFYAMLLRSWGMPALYNRCKQLSKYCPTVMLLQMLMSDCSTDSKDCYNHGNREILRERLASMQLNSCSRIMSFTIMSAEIPSTSLSEHATFVRWCWQTYTHHQSFWVQVHLMWQVPMEAQQAEHYRESGKLFSAQGYWQGSCLKFWSCASCAFVLDLPEMSWVLVRYFYRLVTTAVQLVCMSMKPIDIQFM